MKLTSTHCKTAQELNNKLLAQKNLVKFPKDDSLLFQIRMAHVSNREHEAFELAIKHFSQ